MLLPFLDTAQTWAGPLACDPSMQAALAALGQDEGLRVARAYLRTGELSGVEVPEDVTRVTLRPLSVVERDAAELAAGPAEFFGERVDGQRAAYLLERLQHHAREQAQAGDGTVGELGDAAESAAIDDTLRWLDGLDDERREAWQRFEARQRRLMVERVARGLVDVTGWEPPEGRSKGPDWWRNCIDTLPDGVRRSFVNEAASHLERVGALRGVGKPPCGPRSGGVAPTSLGGDGTATSAPKTTDSGGAAGAAGGR